MLNVNRQQTSNDGKSSNGLWLGELEKGNLKTVNWSWWKVLFKDCSFHFDGTKNMVDMGNSCFWLIEIEKIFSSETSRHNEFLLCRTNGLWLGELEKGNLKTVNWSWWNHWMLIMHEYYCIVSIWLAK
jgi:hypothetical protein